MLQMSQSMANNGNKRGKIKVDKNCDVVRRQGVNKEHEKVKLKSYDNKMRIRVLTTTR